MAPVVVRMHRACVAVSRLPWRRASSAPPREAVLHAIASICYEEGLQAATPARIAQRAGISTGAFARLFADREDCLLAAFEQACAKAERHAKVAFDSQECWEDGFRAGLAALLSLFDQRPQLAKLCVVDALAAGERVQSQRARMLARLSGLVATRRTLSSPVQTPPLSADGAVAVVSAVLQARLSAPGPHHLNDLMGAVMSMVALSSSGVEQARVELV